MGTFSATVDAWVTETKDRTLYVFRESAQRVVEIVQTPVAKGGRLRVDTGFMRASLSASLSGALPVLADRPDDTASYSYEATAVNLIIANATIGDKITLAYAARYAIFREFKDAFVRLPAQGWPRIVADVATEARKRGGG